MSDFATEYTRVKNNISAAYTAIANKGGETPIVKNSANLVTSINSISGIEINGTDENYIVNTGSSVRTGDFVVQAGWNIEKGTFNNTAAPQGRTWRDIIPCSGNLFFLKNSYDDILAVAEYNDEDKSFTIKTQIAIPNEMIGYSDIKQIDDNKVLIFGGSFSNTVSCAIAIYNISSNTITIGNPIQWDDIKYDYLSSGLIKISSTKALILMIPHDTYTYSWTESGTTYSVPAKHLYAQVINISGTTCSKVGTKTEIGVKEKYYLDWFYGDVVNGVFLKDINGTAEIAIAMWVGWGTYKPVMGLNIIEVDSNNNISLIGIYSAGDTDVSGKWGKSNYIVYPGDDSITADSAMWFFPTKSGATNFAWWGKNGDKEYPVYKLNTKVNTGMGDVNNWTCYSTIMDNNNSFALFMHVPDRSIKNYYLVKFNPVSNILDANPTIIPLNSVGYIGITKVANNKIIFIQSTSTQGSGDLFICTYGNESYIQPSRGLTKLEHIIGIAKEDGEAGDTIKVTIPNIQYL